MKHAILAVAALAFLCAAPSAVAATKPARPAGSQVWMGFDVGVLQGEVDLPCGPPGSGRDCSEGGLFPSYTINFTVAGPAAFKIRGVRAEEDTRHKPRELAAMAGSRLGRHAYWLVGMGVIKYADNDYPGNITGFAWEILRARRERDSLGLEMSLHGNIAKDLYYVGFNLGFRIGKLH